MRASCAVAAAVFAALAACGVKGPPRPPAARVEVPAAARGDAGAPVGPEDGGEAPDAGAASCAPGETRP